MACGPVAVNPAVERSSALVCRRLELSIALAIAACSSTASNDADQFDRRSAAAGVYKGRPAPIRPRGSHADPGPSKS
jgi:hypothetical protein